MHTKLMIAVLFSTAASLNASPIADAVASAGSAYGSVAHACVKSAAASLLVASAVAKNVVEPVLTGVARNVAGFLHSLEAHSTVVVVGINAFLLGYLCRMDSEARSVQLEPLRIGVITHASDRSEETGIEVSQEELDEYLFNRDARQ